MQYFRNTIKTLIVVALFSHTTASFAASFSKGKEFAKAIVKVETSNSTGTGFFVRDKYLVTNQHVVGGADKVFITTDEGITFVGKVVRTDIIKDLALVRVPHIGHHKILHPAKRPAEIGDTVRTIAHSFGLEKSFGEGRITGLLTDELDMYMEDIIMFTAPVSFGASGSALMNTDFRVIGVVVAIINGDSNFAIAIPLPELLSFLEDTNNE